MMRTRRILYFLALTTGMLGAADTLFFDVSLLGIRCAAVEISERRLSGDAVEIVYHAFTTGAFDRIYDIDNRYHYYTNSHYSHIDSLKKYIHEKTLDLFYSETLIGDSIVYNDFPALYCTAPVHHVLSFLIYLQHHPEVMETGYSFPFLITDEGDLYHPEIRAETNLNKGQREVFFTLSKVAGEGMPEPTDVFNRTICSQPGQRMPPG